MSSIKGKLFEFFVRELLIACGFQQVIPDDLTVYNGSAGLMVQGLGAAHNADVLLSPPVQTPFYYPTRLIIECKCYSNNIGLPIIRNALGLREDINQLSIVSKDLLRKRQSGNSNFGDFHLPTRYNYQVAVAGINKFASTAFSYADAHHIPLISFAESSLFKRIREDIASIDALAETDCVLKDKVLERLSNKSTAPPCSEFGQFIEDIVELKNKITIGLLDNGTLLFLLRNDHNVSDATDSHRNNKLLKNEFRIQWSSEKDSEWVLETADDTYSFELPKELYDIWLKSALDHKQAAIDIKRQYFSSLVLYEKREFESVQVRFLNISNDFLAEAERKLKAKKRKQKPTA